MDLHKGRGWAKERMGNGDSSMSPRLFPGQPSSEKSQGPRRLLASARLCAKLPGRLLACWEAAGRLPAQLLRASSGSCRLSAHALRSSSGQPRVGWGKARSSLRDCKLTFSRCCCRQNTYTNADKLLEAAEQLAQTGECDPEEIYKAARHLEVRIQDFVRRVEQRKLLLDMSVSFHTHTKEVRARGAGALPGWVCSGKGHVRFLA